MNNSTTPPGTPPEEPGDEPAHVPPEQTGQAADGVDADEVGGAEVDAGAAALEALIADVRAADRHLAQAVCRASELAGSGVAERVAGQPLEYALAVACRQTGADRHTLITAGEVLDDMPCMRRLFADGCLSWGEVRRITQLVKRRSKDDRAELDAHLAATVDARGGLASFDPDHLVEAASVAVDEQRGRAAVERDEAAGIQHSFLAVQRDFYGGARSYGEWDPETAAVVVSALEAAAPPPTSPGRPAAGDPGSPDAADGGDERACGSAWSPTSRSRDYAGALLRICGEWAAGGDGAAVAPRPRARPQLTVQVDLDVASAVAAGRVELPVRGVLPRVSAAVVEALACDADLQVVVADGRRPLVTSDKLTAARIPDKVRVAVKARDGGCRWPGCWAPPGHTELHHLTAQALGGQHHPDGLVELCRVHHRCAHHHGWTLHLDPDSARLTGFRHDRRKWSTLPAATRLSPPRDPPGPDPPAIASPSAVDPSSQPPFEADDRLPF